MASLAIQTEDGGSLVYELDNSVTTIGRALHNSIVLTGESASARHASIRFHPSGFLLYDEGSRNGTHVNASKILQKRLQDGDCIHFGEVRAVFHAADATNASLPETRPIVSQKASARAMPPPVPQLAHTAHVATPAAKTNPLAVWCLILGIGSVLIPSIPILPAFAAMFCGNSALKKIKASNGTEKGRGLAITGLFFSFAYIAIVVFFMIALAFAPGGSPSPAADPTSVGVENLILESWQKDVSQADVQGLFEAIHPAGKATSIRFHDVSINQWRRGIDTNRLEDVVQFTVRMTLYWEGPVTKDGFTKLNVVMDAEAGRPVGMQMLGTNGITKGDAAEAAGNILGLWLQLEAIKRGQENATRQYLNDPYRRAY